jgi:hypothetical protein
VKSEGIDHLYGIYTAERQDDQGALVVAFAIVTTGLTYVIAATPFFLDHCTGAECKNLPVWLQLIAPAVPVSFVGFLVLNVAATRMRSVHLQRLEAELQIRLKDGNYEPRFHTDAGLVYRPDQPLRKPRIGLVFAAITFASYGAVLLVLFGFTWIALAPGPWTALKTVVAVGYGAIEAVELAGFCWPLVHPNFTYFDQPSTDRDEPDQSRERPAPSEPRREQRPGEDPAFP